MGRANDPTMLTAMSAITLEQPAPMVDTMKQVNQFLVYCVSQEDAITTFRKSDMKLAGNRDAGYLNDQKASSRAKDHVYISNSYPLPPSNGSILTILQINTTVMMSTVEAELGALFINAIKPCTCNKFLRRCATNRNKRQYKQKIA